MTDLRKAAEMALERLESHEYWMDDEAIKALRQALAQPVKTYCGGKPNYCTEPESTKWEPAIAHNYNPDGTLQSINVKLIPQSGWVDYEPLKREWVGITHDEVYEFVCTTDSYINLAKAIEAKLKEKNRG
jgi:hypothetical protein